MTTGHQHRRVKVRRDGLVHRTLTRPLWHCMDVPRVDRSPYPYGPCDEHRACWYLSALSVLHRWTGLTLELPDPPEEE